MRFKVSLGSRGSGFCVCIDGFALLQSILKTGVLLNCCKGRPHRFQVSFRELNFWSVGFSVRCWEPGGRGGGGAEVGGGGGGSFRVKAKQGESLFEAWERLNRLLWQ